MRSRQNPIQSPATALQIAPQATHLQFSNVANRARLSPKLLEMIHQKNLVQEQMETESAETSTTKKVVIGSVVGVLLLGGGILIYKKSQN